LQVVPLVNGGTIDAADNEVEHGRPLEPNGMLGARELVHLDNIEAVSVEALDV
jgi:hypothetical protein